MCLIYKSNSVPETETITAYKVFWKLDGKLLSPYFSTFRVHSPGKFTTEKPAYVNRIEIGVNHAVNHLELKETEMSSFVNKALDVSGFHCLKYLKEALNFRNFIASIKVNKPFVVVQVDIDPKDIFMSGYTPFDQMSCRVETYVTTSFSVSKKSFDEAMGN